MDMAPDSTMRRVLRLDLVALSGGIRRIDEGL
jgi:hypothetical protein